MTLEDLKNYIESLIDKNGKDSKVCILMGDNENYQTPTYMPDEYKIEDEFENGYTILNIKTIPTY